MKLVAPFHPIFDWPAIPDFKFPLRTPVYSNGNLTGSSVAVKDFTKILRSFLGWDFVPYLAHLARFSIQNLPRSPSPRDFVPYGSSRIINNEGPARRFLFLLMCLELYIQILKKPREKIKCFETGHPGFHPEFHPEFEFRLMSHIPPTRGGVVFGPTGGL